MNYNIPDVVLKNPTLNPPADQKQPDGPRQLGPCIRASDHILSKVNLATEVLEEAGFTMCRQEWGLTTSDSPLGPGVNLLYHMQFGFEVAPGVPWGLWSNGGGPKTMSSLTGQMAAWMDQYLEPIDVTVRDICDDIRPVGTHNPGAGMADSAEAPGARAPSGAASDRLGLATCNCLVVPDLVLSASDFMCSYLVRLYLTTHYYLTTHRERISFPDDCNCASRMH